MKYFFKFLLVIFLSVYLSCTNKVVKKGKWQGYNPLSIEEIKIENSELIKFEFENQARFHMGNAKYFTIGTFIDSIRVIDKSKQYFISGWLRSIGFKGDPDEFIKHECLFKQGENTYWLPIQEIIIEDLVKGNFKNPIEIYLSLVSTFRSEGGPAIWLFIINRWKG